MTAINTQLIHSLAQVILALNPEEQKLLSQTVEKLRKTFPRASQIDVDQFFQNLNYLEPDPNQPTLQEISQEVREVRRQLRAQS